MGLVRKHQVNMIFLVQVLEASQDPAGYLKQPLCIHGEAAGLLSCRQRPHIPLIYPQT